MKPSTSIPLAICITLVITTIHLAGPQYCPAQAATMASPKVTAEHAVAAAEEKLKLELDRQDLAANHLRQAETRLEEQFAKESGLGVSLESFPDVIRTLQTQRIELMIELAGLEAKRNLLTESLKQKDSKAGEEYNLLREIYSQHLEHFGRLQKLAKKGSVTQTDLARARISVSEAKLRLVKAKSDLGESHESAVLLDLSLERAESKARLDKTKELLASITKARPTLSKREKLNLEKEAASRRYVDVVDEVRNRADELQFMKRELEKIMKQEKIE